MSHPLHFDVLDATHYNAHMRYTLELLTKETLLTRNFWQSTPLHWAARYGHLRQVPNALLTLETMLVKNSIGETPLSSAVQYKYLDQLEGIDFEGSEVARKIVGEDWWAKNAAHLKNLRKIVQYAGEIDI